LVPQDKDPHLSLLPYVITVEGSPSVKAIPFTRLHSISLQERGIDTPYDLQRFDNRNLDVFHYEGGRQDWQLNGGPLTLNCRRGC